MSTPGPKRRRARPGESAHHGGEDDVLPRLWRKKRTIADEGEEERKPKRKRRRIFPRKSADEDSDDADDMEEDWDPATEQTARVIVERLKATRGARKLTEEEEMMLARAKLELKEERAIRAFHDGRKDNTFSSKSWKLSDGT